MQIYLDYSATTPCRPEAIAKMQTVLTQHWGNPSSLHHWGERSAMVIEEARDQVGRLINAPAESLVFTSGGTESNNLAIFGVAAQFDQPQHLIISSVEHSAVSQPARILQRQGWHVSFLPVDGTGRVNPDILRAMIQDNTVLVSVIYGQSEIGTIQPIAELGAIARNHGVLFHTDAVQAAGRISIDVSQCPIDLLSLSSHKIYGPQGSGALYIRPGVEIQAHTHGGGQELQLRPGTQAVPIIAGFGVAAELASQELTAESDRLTQLRDQLFDRLADFPRLVPTGDRKHRLPHHVSFCLQPEQEVSTSGRDIVRAMNRAGIGISAGSACNSGKTVPSPVLKAMGFGDEQAKSGLRLTLGRETRQEDIEKAATQLMTVLHTLAPSN